LIPVEVGGLETSYIGKLTRVSHGKALVLRSMLTFRHCRVFVRAMKYKCCVQVIYERRQV
jgi:hypothetical protein